MNRSFSLAAALLIAAVSLPLGACRENAPTAEAAEATAQLLPRNSVVPVSVVTQHFPGVTEEASIGPNQTTVGNATRSISVVFTSADGKGKVTLSVDEYASADDAAAAFQTAVEGSKVAPGFKPAAPPDLGQQAFAGSSQVGAEQHFGLGALDGRLIMSATHAGNIPVTAENSSKLIDLGRAELDTARQALGQ
jgi:hypothetical protein